MVVPMAETDDDRYAANIELTKKLSCHSLSAKASFSTEDDYDSVGIACTDSIDLNRKNTTLSLGAAYAHDRAKDFFTGSSEPKDVMNLMVGISQLLSLKTVFTGNVSCGFLSGYLNDQYKVVELNGGLVPEERPDHKTGWIVYMALKQYVERMRASVEAGYRLYDDTFGIIAHTMSLTWNQKLGGHLELAPTVRWYDQSEADFYAIRFTGSPDTYSSDYRLSALTTVSYGVRVAWAFVRVHR